MDINKCNVEYDNQEYYFDKSIEDPKLTKAYKYSFIILTSIFTIIFIILAYKTYIRDERKVTGGFIVVILLIFIFILLIIYNVTELIKVNIKISRSIKTGRPCYSHKENKAILSSGERIDFDMNNYELINLANKQKEVITTQAQTTQAQTTQAQTTQAQTTQAQTTQAQTIQAQTIQAQTTQAQTTQAQTTQAQTTRT